MTDAMPDPGDFSRRPEAEIFAWLDARGIPHSSVAHPPTFTVADSALVKTDIPGAHTKNLFLKDKKGQLVLVSAAAQSELRLNQLHKQIGGQRLSFGRDDLLWGALRVTPGSVSAFALIHDPDQRVRFIVDDVLAKADTVNFHPLRCDMTTALSQQAFRDMTAATGHSFECVDFSQL